MNTRVHEENRVPRENKRYVIIYSERRALLMLDISGKVCFMIDLLIFCAHSSRVPAIHTISPYDNNT